MGTSGIVSGVAAGNATITYALSTGCIATAVVTVNSQPTAITGTLALCAGSASTLANATAGGAWSSSNTAVATVGASGIVSGVAAGNAIITYALATGCFATATVTVTAMPAAITGVAAICEGAVITLANAVAGGTWAADNGNVTVGTSSGIVAAVSAGTSLVTYTLSTGCSVTAEVTVNAQPAAITGTMTICSGNTTTLSNATAGGVWSSADATVSVDGTSGVITAVSAGTALITYAMPAGCAATATVTVNEAPAAITGDITICAAQTGTLVSATAGGTWASSNTAVATIDASGVLSGVAAGNATITYTVAGCATTTVVTVATSPSAITGTFTMCNGAGTTLANAVAGGTWASSDNTVATIDAATGVVTSVAAGTATITYAVAAGCPATRVITVNAAPAAITGVPVVCKNAISMLANTVAGGIWSTSNMAIARVGTGGKLTGMAPGTAIISYTLASGCGATIPVTVNALPAAITGAASLCLGVNLPYTNATTGGAWSTANAAVATMGTTGLLTSASVGNTTISYTLGTGCYITAPVTVNAAVTAITGTPSVCTGATTTLANPTAGGTWSSNVPAYAPINATTGVVSGVTVGTILMTYTTGANCYATVPVTVNQMPVAIGGVPTVCLGSVTSLSNATTGGTWTSSNTAVATASYLSGTWGLVTSVATGTATVTYTLPSGCYVTKQVTVNPLAAVTGAATICVGSTATMANAVAGGAWSCSQPSIVSINTAGVITGLAAGSVTITYAHTTTGCKSTMPVVSSMVYGITGSAVACTGSTITLANPIAGGTWSAADASVAAVPATSGVVTGIAAGTTTISYTNAAGCLKTAVVTVNPGAAAIVGANAICAGSTATMSNTATGGTWTSSNASIASVSAAGVVTGTSPGLTVTISYTLPAGCRATKVVSVTALPGAISGTAAICQGAATTLASGTAGGSWTSSDAGIATVGSANGVVTAVAPGTAVVTYTLGTGCMQTRVVTVNAFAATTGAAPVCVGAAISLSNTVAGGTWTSASGLATVNTSGVVTGVAAGTVAISYSLASGCRSLSIITINAIPAITGTATMCPGVTVTLAGSVAGGTWSSSNAGVATVGAANGVVTGVAGGNAGISYTMPSGCAAVRIVTVSTAPSAISGVAVMCAGSSVVLTNTVSGGVWTSSNVSIATVSGGVVTGVAGGTATITYSTGTSCIVTQVVTVNPILPITGTQSACLGMTTTLACGTAGGTWNSSNPSVAPISTTGVVTGMAVGTVVVNYTIASGCSRSVVVSVNVAPSSISGTAVMCAGLTTTLEGNVGGGTWSSSNASVASVGSATGVVTGVAGGTATVTYTGGLGCRVTAVVTVNSIGAITGATKACAGSNTTLGNATAGGAWSSSNAASAAIDATTGVVTGVSAGTATITYTPASGCGRTVVVTINALPSATGGTLSACVGGATVINNGTPNGVSWTSSNSSIASVGVSSGLVTGVAAGTATITYTVNTGCIMTAVYTVNPLPAAITGATAFCLGSEITLSNSTDGGTWISGNFGRASIGAATGIVTGITAGTLAVTYSLPTGCKTSTIVTVNASSPITGTASINEGAATTLSNAVAGGSWLSADGAVATVDYYTGVVSGVAAGTSVITYTTSAGCERSAVVTVNALAARGAAAAISSIEVGVYPNPSNGVFTVNASVAGTFAIFSVDGKMVASYSVGAGVTQLQLPTGVVAGAYLCRFTDVNEHSTTVRLVYQP